MTGWRANKDSSTAVAITLLAAACGGSHQRSAEDDEPPPKIARSVAVTEHDVARTFAIAYLAYIDGRAKPSTLPDATDAVRAAASAGGVIPARKRAGKLQLVGLKNAAGVAGGVLITARNRAGTLYAQETLTRAGSGWRVTNLLTPDFVQVFVKQTTATIPRPAGSAGPEAAARVFLAGYLPWYYGHAPASSGPTA